MAYGGSAPGSPLLSDGTAVYTDGISERRGGVSKFYLEDLVGSLTKLEDSSANFTDGTWYDAFGLITSHAGSTPTPFGYTGATGGQTDATSGLVLMGHRFSRTDQSGNTTCYGTSASASR